MGSATTEFRILGPLEARIDGGSAPLGGPKQRAVLAELLLHANSVVPRSQLVDAVWGDDPPGSTTSSLQVYVHGLRRVLGADRIETNGNGYRLRLEQDELDLNRFESLVASGRRALASGRPGEAEESLRTALGLWHGPVLADLADQPVAASHGPRLESRRLEAVELRNDAELALGRHEAVLAEVERLIEEHPYRERLREQQILALYRSGRQKDALDAYRAARDLLVDELGIEPGPALQELERAVLRQEAELAAPPQPAAAPTRLPAPPSSFVGRRLELAAVTALLRSDDVRLATLVGPGGTGKTRLALAVAHELAAGCRDGAVFVDLAAVADGDLLVPEIARALRVADGEGPLEDALAEHLHDRALLLVLDNFEHLLEAAPRVGELLRAAPRLRVLATSREPLRLSGEHEYPVPPLPVPPPSTSSLPAISGSDAVRLFEVRARAVDPSFVLDETNADAVATICRRLDGLPLAIELAATQSRRLAPAALAERLEQALDLLVEGARDVPLRQQTLRATLDWSYRLLEPAEQQLLARLAVFSGSSAVGDVHAVVGGDAADLSALVDKSLLRSVPDGDTARVAMLETIREYALEQLAGSGEEARYRRLHAEHYLELAERAASTILNGGDETVYERLDAEHDNLRAALTWLQGRDLALELRLAIALRWFWVVRGYLSEARRFYEVTIANVDSGGTPAQRADARAHGGVFAYRQGDLAAAQRDWEQALELYRETDNLDGVSRCTAELGAVALGNGEIDAARTLYEQAAELYRQHGYPVRLGIALSNLTDIARTVGDAAAAVRYGKQAVEIAREIGDKDGLAVALYNLARAAKDVGEDARARCLLAESLELARRLGYREVTAYCLEGAAELALADGDPERAARLLSASDALFAGIGAKLQGPESETRARVLAELRERLGDEVLAALGEQAAGVRFEDVLDEALALTATP